MKILVDEHIPLMTVRALHMMGHDVRDIRGTPDEGMADDVLWEMAQREARLLITTDKGFTQYRTVPHHGVLIIRLRRPDRHKIHERIMQAMRQFTEEQWPGLLVVIAMLRRASGAPRRATEPNTRFSRLPTASAALRLPGAAEAERYTAIS